MQDIDSVLFARVVKRFYTGESWQTEHANLMHMKANFMFCVPKEFTVGSKYYCRVSQQFSDVHGGDTDIVIMLVKEIQNEISCS